jgi:hypothetical protein
MRAASAVLLQVAPMDVALVALGAPDVLPDIRGPARPEDGFHFNLFNNAWGTNYIMWTPYADTVGRGIKSRYALNRSQHAFAQQHAFALRTSRHAFAQQDTHLWHTRLRPRACVRALLATLLWCCTLATVRCSHPAVALQVCNHSARHSHACSSCQLVPTA